MHTFNGKGLMNDWVPEALKEHKCHCNSNSWFKCKREANTDPGYPTLGYYALMSVHIFSVFPGIKGVMAQCKNGTENEHSYGRYKRFPFLKTKMLYFGQSIAGMGLPTSEHSASAPLVLLVQKGCGFQRALLDDHGLPLLSLLEWWWVPRRMSNQRSSLDK